MRNTYFHRVQAQTPTRLWINNVTRSEANLASTQERSDARKILHIRGKCLKALRKSPLF